MKSVQQIPRVHPNTTVVDRVPRLAERASFVFRTSLRLWADSADISVFERKVLIVKSFACGDVVPGCEASWVCATEDEILYQVAQHAAEAHGMSDVPVTVVQAVQAAIVTVG